MPIPTTSFRLEPRGPYALAASSRFLTGFTPASGSAARLDDALVLGFRLDGSYAPVGVMLRERAGVVHGEVVGTEDMNTVARQTARILSLDHDGAAFPVVGERDPIVGALQARFPGLRPVCFASPYEAAVSGVLAQRIGMPQAAKVKLAFATQHGNAVTLGGHTLHVVPSPQRLLEVTSFPALPDEKLARLKGIARAALDGQLDAEALRALPEDFALARLEGLRGVGAWTAAHVLYRGTGVVDALATVEPRVLRGIQVAYGLAHLPDDADLARITAAWRPYRMWVSVLMVMALSDTPQWHGPEKRGRRMPR